MLPVSLYCSVRSRCARTVAHRPKSKSFRTPSAGPPMLSGLISLRQTDRQTDRPHRLSDPLVASHSAVPVSLPVDDVAVLVPVVVQVGQGLGQVMGQLKSLQQSEPSTLVPLAEPRRPALKQCSHTFLQHI